MNGIERLQRFPNTALKVTCVSQKPGGIWVVTNLHGETVSQRLLEPTEETLANVVADSVRTLFGRLAVRDGEDPHPRDWTGKGGRTRD